MWDFSLLSHGTSKAEIVPGGEAFAQAVRAPLAGIFFVVVLIAHKSWMIGSLSDDRPAAAETA